MFSIVLLNAPARNKDCAANDCRHNYTHTTNVDYREEHYEEEIPRSRGTVSPLYPLCVEAQHFAWNRYGAQ